MRSRVSCWISGLPASARDTVAVDTPVMRAMSDIWMRLPMPVPRCPRPDWGLGGFGWETVIGFVCSYADYSSP